MAEITITVNSNAVRQLMKSAPDKLDNAIRGTLTDSSTYFLALMKRYPPTRPNQRYIRTGNLGRSWSGGVVTSTSSGWRVVVGSNANMAPYNRRVQSRGEQGHWFVGRWRTAEDAVEQGASQVQRFADARFRAALGGI